MPTRPLIACLLACVALAAPASAQEQPPNIVILFADDLGYGDLATYGHPTIRTPHLDRMAEEGMKFMQFYTASSVCTPSRAALLTGRYPIRNGMTSDRRRVFFPDSKYGLPHDEVTIAEALKTKGYATAAIGKWHLGHLPEYLPTRHGFDTYFGIPYSNDMDRVAESRSLGRDAFWDPRIQYWDVPILRDEEVFERPADQRTITRRYTEEAIRFMREHRDRPFFVYLAYNLPHVPLFASEAFLGKSPRGLYGDVVEEIDWSVGQVMETLRELGLAERTLVFFTSDNGPWLVFDTHGGSAGLLRGGKGMTWDGGMRVPGLAWWPGTVPGGTVNRQVTSTMDLFSTSLDLAGVAAPTDRTIDGRSMRHLLTGRSDAPIRDTYFFYRGERVYAVRHGPWKAHFITQWAYTPDSDPVVHRVPELYHMLHDPSEQYDLAERNPEVIEETRRELERHVAGVERVPTWLDERIETTQR